MYFQFDYKRFVSERLKPLEKYFLVKIILKWSIIVYYFLLISLLTVTWWQCDVHVQMNKSGMHSSNVYLH